VNRWAIRIAGIIMLLIFMLVFINLQKQLAMMQRARGGQRPATTTTR
jgi:hypothetical protein